MLFLCIFYSLIAITVKASDTPIIGILSQETFIVAKYFEANYDSFIAASYVKFLESSGARVLPIWIGQDNEYYQRVVNYTNGIVFPGGGTYFDEPGGYGEAAKQLYSLAIKANSNGIYYPIWGTCLGMEALAFAAVGHDIRVNCSLKHKSVSLDFQKDFKTSKLFSKAPDDVVEDLKQKNLTYNYHRYCLTETVLKENNLLDSWRVISTNKDENQLEFISSFESTLYPFYGVQFHPEKNSFEFRANINISHTSEAVKITQYFSNFFVDECRKNDNKFPSDDMERTSLIYNYDPTYTGLKANASYEQIYVFKKDQFKKNQLR